MEKEQLACNNSPFSCKGKMNLLPFFITVVVLVGLCGFLTKILPGIYLMFDNKYAWCIKPFNIIVTFFISILVFFAFIKRFRALKCYNEYFLSFCQKHIKYFYRENIVQSGPVAYLQNEVLKINNNPFGYRGRMTRLPYFITRIIILALIFLACYVFLVLFIVLGKDYEWLSKMFFILVVLVLVVCSIFSDLKRLRDLKWNRWFVVLGFIPYLCFIYGLTLILVKGKFDTMEQSLDK